ncbi:hypothetical protein F4808DRAFT_343839 [Astrocystis sublimbata]|nr:hypothetical protein F4808DRAFT_343839 [Astrocystis sublimbata]
MQTRQRWHKSKTHSGVSEQNTPSRPLERVADATKHKLNAFNFCPPTNGSEATEPVKQAVVDENDRPVEHDVGVSSLAPNLPSLPEPTLHVSTPVCRLAWQDLIGDPDVKEDNHDGSPQEKIEWDTRHKPAYGVSPMPRKRGSKRARSSSPVSSPAAACSKSMIPRLGVSNASALQSPRADPSIELWDRFSLSGSAATTPLGAANPTLASFMVSSSPQPKSGGLGRGEAGLRRAISCGTIWPKRRRVERSEAAPAPSVVVQGGPSHNSKSSMVNALLESVTGELNRSKAAQTRLDVLRSPSPQKTLTNPAHHLSGSPRQRLSPSKSTFDQRPGAVDVSKGTGADDNSSDYGDDDFDDDTLMSLDVDVNPPLAQTSPATLPPSQECAFKQATTSNPSTAGGNTMLDEFADLDDDIFADAGELLSQIESACENGQPTTTSHSCVPGNTFAKNTVPDEPTEDMYGDDFGGDFDFEAAEIAATQSTKQPNGSIPSVSISKTQDDSALPGDSSLGEHVHG